MVDSNIHRLLKRQILNANFTVDDLNKFKDFFEVVNDAYKSFDDDVKHIEVILEQSSNELYKRNKTLKNEVFEAENELDTIVNSIEGVIFKTDMLGNFKYLNKAWEDLTGIEIEKALNNKYRELLFGKNDKEKVRIHDFFNSDKEEYSTLFKFCKSNGNIVWLQLKVEKIKDVYGEFCSAIGTMIDVTQLKETEIKLNRANKTKDEFLSTMSHEIRTPLNAVIGMSEILLMDKFLPEQLENLEVLKYSSEHLLALVNDLLDLNKFKSKEIKLFEDDFNLSELVQNIKLHFNQTAIKQNLSFDTAIDSEIPTILKGDSLKLSQVLKNLLSNAFKFTHDGGVVFKIELIEAKDDTSKIRFSVLDTGIGVSYNKQKDIFRSFVQASNNTSKLYGGSGLGLYISRELLKIQKSDLHVDSTVGEGSTFWFEIILKNSGQITISKQRSITKTENLELNVLVAEDTSLNALILKKLFKNWGIDYDIATDGQELLDIYPNKEYDLILMDLQMPVLDGYKTTKAIRKLEDSSKSAIPIIALTAFTESEVGDKIKQYKMDGYLSKPFDVCHLYELLSFYANKKRLAV